MRVAEAVSEVTSDGGGGGIAWPVVIIGGLVIVAGLFALRGEFRNLRERRAKR